MTFMGITDPSALQGIQMQTNMFALATQPWRTQEYVSSGVFGGYVQGTILTKTAVNLQHSYFVELKR